MDEPEAAGEYAALLTGVAATGRPVIVCRNGIELAAIIPLEHLELVRGILAHQELEKLAATMGWSGSKAPRPPQSWFEDEGDNPFEPEEEPAP
jgi:hypothetical protein